MKAYSVRLMILGLVVASLGCAEYSYQVRNSPVPVSFANEAPEGQTGRPFAFRRKMTYVLFDLVNVQEFDLGDALRKELPNAKLIYNLKIRSEEDSVDSLIRTVTTFLQIWAFVSDRPFVSRRTIYVEGFVID